MYINYLELKKAQLEYEQKLKSSHPSEQAMFSLVWEVEELTQLCDEGHALRVEILAAQDVLNMPDTERHHHNLPRKLCSIREKRIDMIKRTIRFRRQPATHVFVIMISSEFRDRKPYALPVQCVPYSGLKEKDIRRLANELIKVMVLYGMNVAGKLQCMRLLSLYLQE